MRLLIVAGSLIMAANLLQAQAPAAVPTPAQLHTGTSVPMPAYDVVSIKPHQGGDGSGFHGGPDRFQANNVKLAWLIMSAFALQMEDQVAGLPGWAETARYDVEAKLDAEGVAAIKARKDYPENKDWHNNDQARMLQAVLADRFGLVVHRSTKEMPIFALVVAKGGPKLKESDAKEAAAGAPPKGLGGPGSMRMWFENGGFTINAYGYRMSGLAVQMQGETHRIVEDKTGLSGVYDFTLRYQPESMGCAVAGGSAADTPPSIFTALQEQLGLKLEPARAPVLTIAVDQAHPPSEN